MLAACVSSLTSTALQTADVMMRGLDLRRFGVQAVGECGFRRAWQRSVGGGVVESGGCKKRIRVKKTRGQLTLLGKLRRSHTSRREDRRLCTTAVGLGGVTVSAADGTHGITELLPSNQFISISLSGRISYREGLRPHVEPISTSTLVARLPIFYAVA